MKEVYPVFIADYKKNYLVFVPDFDIYTEGKSLANAIEMARDAIGLKGIDLEDDKKSFKRLGITYEEKVFFDILIAVRDDHAFLYVEEKCLVLAKEIKRLVDDKSKFADPCFHKKRGIFE